MGTDFVELNGKFYVQTVDGRYIEFDEIGDLNMENKEYDIINKARHYNRDGAIECIDEMEIIYGKEALMWFCLLSQHKYRYRAGLKDDGFQDLEKSDYYMRKYRDLKRQIEAEKATSFTHYEIPKEWTITCDSSKESL